MLKQNLVNHPFHGQLETLNTNQFMLDTVWLELTEFTVLLALAFFIFFKFGNTVWERSQKKSEQKFQKQSSLFPLQPTSVRQKQQ
jgi:hypothetical protein